MSQPSSEARHRFQINLHRLRKEKGWSQEELASRCGLHRTFVSSVERGERNISIDNVGRLALALEVDVQALFEPVSQE